MKTKCKFNNPDEMEVEMTVTMTLGEWRHVAETLQESRVYEPSYRLFGEIRSVVRQCEQTFYPMESDK